MTSDTEADLLCNSVFGPSTNKMGLGLVRTRSGYDSSEPHTQSRCKPILRSMMEWTRDLVLLLFYTLPGTPKTLRVYGLMVVRMLLYGIEGLILYSLTLTIVVGEQVKDPGVLVELTRWRRWWGCSGKPSRSSCRPAGQARPELPTALDKSR